MRKEDEEGRENERWMGRDMKVEIETNGGEGEKKDGRESVRVKERLTNEEKKRSGEGEEIVE